MNMVKKNILLSISLFLCLSAIPGDVFATVTVSPATGGSAISADTTGGAYTALTGPVISEGATGDIGAGTIILNAPAGFIFDIGGTAPTILITWLGGGSGAGGDNLNNKVNGTVDTNVTRTATQITYNITAVTTNLSRNSLTWQNIRVRPTAGAPLVSGNIVKTGTSVISGVTASITNLGTLTESAGAKSQIIYSTQPSGTATAGVDFDAKPVFVIRDQFGNTVGSDNSTTITLSSVLSTQICGGTSGSGVLTSIPASGASVTNGVMTYSAMQYSAGESIRICATSTGITSALSDTIVVTAAPIPTPTPTPIPTPTPSSTPVPAPEDSGSNIGTINVAKIVVNDNGGTRVVSDFPLFINGQPAVSGQTYNFTALGPLFTVSETGDLNYARSFSGDCDFNGQLNLMPGQNKFCIVVNNDIGVGTVMPIPMPPLIDVVRASSPLALPDGPDLVTYTYTLRNIGTVPVTDITMVGDACSPIVFISGDTNNNSILNVGEVWTYSCSTALFETSTGTVTATGWANGISAVDIASSTVVVGAPGLPNTGVTPPLIHVIKVPSPLALLAGGGAVTYSYRVTNPGIVALDYVYLTDDHCSSIKYVSGDNNGDLKLDTIEEWIYTCQTNLTATTTNTVMARGEVNGLVARDFAIITVVVAVSEISADLLQQVRAITANLSVGSVGEDVRTLQRFLIFEDKGPAAKALGSHGTTLNFGLMTHTALLEWQKAVGLLLPTGNFGPATRAYLDEYYTYTPPNLPNTGLPSNLNFTSLSEIGLKDGDVIGSSDSGDSDIYIVNQWGYKRLFLNPVIFGFYGHLGGFSVVKNLPVSTGNMLIPSGLFRNCETNLAGQVDPRVYGLEITGEDTGTLHWINTTGEQAVADDKDFFKKVFCLNNNEFNWYKKGSDYTSVSQVPVYSR